MLDISRGVNVELYPTRKACYAGFYPLFAIVKSSLISSMGAQRMGSQMMPTLGFNNSNTNQSYMKTDMSNNVVGLSTIDLTMVSQPLNQKHQVGGQNSRILHSLGSHMGGGIRSTLQHKAYGFSNTPSHYGTIVNVHQQQMSQGDGYGSSTTDSSRTRNFYVPTTSNTSMMNNQSSSQSSCISLACYMFVQCIFCKSKECKEWHKILMD
uniref:Uncharacterized protein n=1 Tax=Lactuca sativa TaxID=4236 RepID=A0A9R1VSF3_LACSA|nr:hypothetical protein LSAT_V11C400226120 [Lactuca sativa]